MKICVIAQDPMLAERIDCCHSRSHVFYLLMEAVEFFEEVDDFEAAEQ